MSPTLATTEPQKLELEEYIKINSITDPGSLEANAAEPVARGMAHIPMRLRAYCSFYPRSRSGPLSKAMVFFPLGEMA